MVTTARHEPQHRAKSCPVCGAPRTYSEARAARTTCPECANVPSPQPAVAMRVALARARASGMSFPEAWAECLPAVLDAVPDRERADWSAAFEWGASFWRDAYTRTGNVCRLATPDEDRAMFPGIAMLDRAA